MSFCVTTWERIQNAIITLLNYLIYEYLWQTLLAAYTESIFPFYLSKRLILLGAATCLSIFPVYLVRGVAHELRAESLEEGFRKVRWQD